MNDAVSFLENQDISELENLLIKDNKIIPVPAREVNKFSQEQITLFCVKHAVYQIPTTELINFLKNEIVDQSAIEIGSGNGAIGRALDIPRTDNKMQERDDIIMLYLLMGQRPITYPEDIRELNGNEAVKKYRPSVVVASWLTDRNCGNYYGIDEPEIVKAINKYIHIGNEKTHSRKSILTKFKHQKIKADWLISRSLNRSGNVIYLFS